MKKNAPMSPAAVLRSLGLPSDATPIEQHTFKKILGGARIDFARAIVISGINFANSANTKSIFSVSYLLNLQRDYDLYRLAQELERAGDEIIAATQVDWDRADSTDTVKLGEKAKRDAAKILKHWGWK